MINSSMPLFSVEKNEMNILQENFCNIFAKDKKYEAITLFKKITKEYQNKTRSYHNLEHIENLLIFLKKYEKEIKDINGMKLAAWLHDVIYDTKAKDNEQQSSQYAKNHLIELGISKQIIDHVIALILATEKHEIIANDSDSMIFLDWDLVILGSNEKDYDKYATKIRQEYCWIPYEQYKAGRKKILQNFLKRPKIYFTEKIYKEFESQARKNMEKEILILS